MFCSVLVLSFLFRIFSLSLVLFVAVLLHALAYFLVRPFVVIIITIVFFFLLSCFVLFHFSTRLWKLMMKLHTLSYSFFVVVFVVAGYVFSACGGSGSKLMREGV